MAVLLLVFHLGIGDGGVAGGAPVDHPVAAVDKPLFIQAHKHFFYGGGAALVHGEAFPLPVTAGTDGFELADDAVAVGFFPIPSAFEEPFSAEHILGQPFLAHRLHHLGFGCNGGVVGAGHPQGFVSLHAAPTHQNILQCIIQSMAHMQLSGDVRGRHHDRVGFFLFSVSIFGVSGCVEIAAIQPKTVDAVFHLLRLIHLCQLFMLCHVVSSFLYQQNPVRPRLRGCVCGGLVFPPQHPHDLPHIHTVVVRVGVVLR